MDDAQTALTGIGQFDVTATPLQMAMVSAAIANDGKLVKPHMVDQIDATRAPDVARENRRRRTLHPGDRRSSHGAAAAVGDADGRGEGHGHQRAGSPASTVGGKTGTAQHGENNSKNPYAWFTSYAKDGERISRSRSRWWSRTATQPRADISGGGLAAPIAKSMMSAAVGGGTAS